MEKEQSRLDFFFISETFLTLAPKIYYENSYRSNHSPVLLCIKTNEFQTGKGYWKFNNSLLTDIEFMNIIKKQICEVKSQYYGVPLGHSRSRASPFYINIKTRDFHMKTPNVSEI